MKLPTALLLGATCVASLSVQSSAAAIKDVPGKHGVVIQLSGMIVPGDADALLNSVRRLEDGGKSIETVQLNSNGGNLGEAARLAAVIQQQRLSTAVTSGAVCASACFLAFAAGQPKFASRDARIGVHRAADKTGSETRSSAQATVLMGSFARGLGIPPEIVSRMLTTSPKTIAWLEPKELQLMAVKGLSELGRSTLEAVTAPGTSTVSIQPTKTNREKDSEAWNTFIQSTIVLSAEQNNGHPIMRRLCNPEVGECVLGVAYAVPDGRQALAIAAQDAKGNVTRREVCENNTANDARDCINWDTGVKYREFKNSKGDWVQTQQ
jgi:hypothetical protein